MCVCVRRDSCSIQSSVTVSCWQTSCLLTVWSLSSWTGCCLMSTWVRSHHTSPLYLKLVMSRWKYESYYMWHPVGDNSFLFLIYILGNFPNSLKANPRTLSYRQEATIADILFLHVFSSVKKPWGFMTWTQYTQSSIHKTLVWLKTDNWKYKVIKHFS